MQRRVKNSGSMIWHQINALYLLISYVLKLEINLIFYGKVSLFILCYVHLTLFYAILTTQRHRK